MISEKIAFCKKNVSVLKAEEVRKICIEFDFDLDKIEEYLKCYEIEEKYKGVAAYQWQETLTREQKAQQRKMKYLEAERKRRRQERLARLRAEREERRKER